MSEIMPEKTHALLEKLADFVMTEVSTKAEVNQKIAQVDAKIDKLADFVMTEVSTKAEVNQKIAQVDAKIDKLADYVMNEVSTKMEFQELKDKVDTIIDGMDKQAQQLDNIRTEQLAFNHGFNRLEKRVEKLEHTH